jgi:enoyl-CoA hydratase/carnithine racemase
MAGIAFCLSLFCDFRYMAEGAKMTNGLRQTRPLPCLIGPMNALDLLYFARTVDAAEVERLGLVRTTSKGDPGKAFTAMHEHT